MPAGKKRKGVKKKVGSEKEVRATKAKEHPVVKVGKVQEEAKCSSPVKLRRSKRKEANIQKNVEIETVEPEKSKDRTADPYDADSENENISVNDQSDNEKGRQDCVQSAKIKDFKPTPLLSHFVSSIHANDHSTPSDSSAPGTDDSCFGFDSLDTIHKKKFSFSPIVADTGIPLSSFSPMSTISFAESTGSRPSFLKPKSPLKDHSLNKIKVPLSLGITQLPIEKPERKTKKKAAPKKKKDENAWVNEWADMFKDVEGHDLLVE